MKCGLLGRHLGHSYSPQIHAYLGDYTYKLYEKEPDEIGFFLKNGDFSGINVTIPYKKDVLPFLDEVSPAAQKLGAVNTIVRRNGKLVGHNTDYYGFLYMLKASGLTVCGKKVLVLGSGGASNTVVAVLREQGAQVIVISRSGDNNYTNLHLHSDTAAIVNATPVGMYPNPGVSPLSLDLFPHLEGVLDLIYNPARTKLLLEAERRGLIAMNGLLMLVAQAKEAAEWFLNQSICESVISEIHTRLRRQMENIILIGMPGCGKSTVGALLAKALQKHFADADSALVADAGQSIPDIFAQRGEAVFRELETQTLAKLAMRSGMVIATGGGCVTKEENYPLLHQNGTIFWLKRALDQLPTEGRPLSQRNRLEEMWQIRRPLYSRFADMEINNEGTPEETVAAILKELER